MPSHAFDRNPAELSRRRDPRPN